jgi:hypothetical protein
MIIETAINGFIISNMREDKQIAQTLEQVFDAMLRYYEGRSTWFGDGKFGKVLILREPTEEYPYDEVEPA